MVQAEGAWEVKGSKNKNKTGFITEMARNLVELRPRNMIISSNFISTIKLTFTFFAINTRAKTLERKIKLDLIYNVVQYDHVSSQNFRHTLYSVFRCK